MPKIDKRLLISVKIVPLSIIFIDFIGIANRDKFDNWSFISKKNYYSVKEILIQHISQRNNFFSLNNLFDW